MICPKCHSTIPDHSKFCTRCGTKIEELPVSHTTFPDHTQNHLQQADSRQKQPQAEASFSLGKAAGQAASAADQLIRNTDFKNLNPSGCAVFMTFGWLIVFAGCFTGLLRSFGQTVSFLQLAEVLKTYVKIDLHFGLIVFLCGILTLMGLYLAFASKNRETIKIQTCFGIVSLITSFLLSLFYGIMVIAGQEIFLFPSLTSMGWISCLLSSGLLIASITELHLLCQPPGNTNIKERS